MFLCKLNTSIRVDAKRLGIPNYQLMALDELFHQENGNSKPENLIDLLEVVC